MGSKRDVKLYSRPDCPWCRKTKQLLEEYGVEYRDFNIALDLEALRDWISKSDFMDVPVVEIDGEIIAGYNPRKLKERLAPSLLRAHSEN